MGKGNDVFACDRDGYILGYAYTVDICAIAALVNDCHFPGGGDIKQRMTTADHIGGVIDNDVAVEIATYGVCFHFLVSSLAFSTTDCFMALIFLFSRAPCSISFNKSMRSILRMSLESFAADRAFF